MDQACSDFIGVIGGMGPAATSDFLGKLVTASEAKRDQDNIPVLVWGDCRVPDRSTALIEDPTGVSRMLTSAARVLASLGAKALVMPCNTAHVWAPDIEACVSIPLLHIVDAAIEKLTKAKVKSVGLLATRGTVEAHLYDEKLADASISLINPTARAQRMIDECIALIKAGRLREARSVIDPALTALRDEGVDRIVLACTELPIILSNEADTLDATRALAEYTKAWWLDHVTSKNTIAGSMA